MDLELLVPVAPGNQVGVRGQVPDFVMHTPGISVVALDGSNAVAVDVVVAEVDGSGIVDTACLRPGGWLVGTVTLARDASRRVRRLRRHLSEAGFVAIDVFGAEGVEQEATKPDVLVSLDVSAPTRDLFGRIFAPMTAGQHVRGRTAPALCALRRQRLAFRSFVVVARSAS